MIYDIVKHSIYMYIQDYKRTSTSLPLKLAGLMAVKLWTQI